MPGFSIKNFNSESLLPSCGLTDDISVLTPPTHRSKPMIGLDVVPSPKDNRWILFTDDFPLALEHPVPFPIGQSGGFMKRQLGCPFERMTTIFVAQIDYAQQLAGAKKDPILPQDPANKDTAHHDNQPPWE
jgi:hypothetical protein